MTSASAPPSPDAAIAALDTAQKTVDAATAVATNALHSGLQGWSPDLVKFLAISVLAFTFSALLLSAILMWRSRASGFHILRVFGIVCILGISALLLVVGYSNEQLTPIVGLFGAIAGYLLGKETTTKATAGRDDA